MGEVITKLKPFRLKVKKGNYYIINCIEHKYEDGTIYYQGGIDKFKIDYNWFCLKKGDTDFQCNKIQLDGEYSKQTLLDLVELYDKIIINLNKQI